MRGRMPKPAKQRALASDPHRGRRPRRAKGSVPSSSRVGQSLAADVASCLSEPGVAEFHRVLALCTEHGASEQADRVAVAQYAVAWDFYQRAVTLCNTQGLVSPDGRPTGAFRAWKDAAQELRRAQQEMGLTPQSRQRLPQPDPQPEADVVGARDRKTD